MKCNCAVVWAFFGIDFLRDWNENRHFPVLWPLLSFPNLLAYWVQHFHSIIFQDLEQLNWNSITSTSFVHSDASEGPLDFTFQDVWLSVSDHTIMIILVMKLFLYSSSVYSCHLFLISSASVTSITFLSFMDPIFAWNVPLVSNFLEEISSLPQSVLFLYFFALIAEEDFLISPYYSLELCIQTFFFLFLLCLLFLFFSAICKTSSHNHFSLLAFHFLRDGFDHHLL